MKTITGKLMLSVSLLILFFIILIYGANVFFLDDFYLLKIKTSFEQEYLYLSETFNSGSYDFLTVIRSRSNDTGMRYTISDLNRNILYSSAPEFRNQNKTRLTKEKEQLIDRIENPFFYGIIQRGESTKKDILLAGYLSRDSILFVTLPLEHLLENARISNQFLLLIGTFAFLFSLLSAWFFSKKTVRPIRDLIKLSEKIADLDFSYKYSGKRNDEIDNLGYSLNLTAEKLEQTITNLKKEMALQQRFQASITHELKSPVALIRGYSEALGLVTENRNELKEYTDIILSESDRLNLLINDLLMFMKLNSTSFILDLRNFDIVESVKEIQAKYRILTNETSIGIILKTPESLLIFADEKRLVQAIENVLNNAMKHCKKQGTISIELYKRSDKVLLTVSNEGNPIEETHLPHLFDPFYSAPEARNRATTGSGLGLSIVKSIIEKHDGSCLIDNTDKGVIVTFKIPMVNK